MSRNIQISVPAEPAYLRLAAEFFERAEKILDHPPYVEPAGVIGATTLEEISEILADLSQAQVDEFSDLELDEDAGDAFEEAPVREPVYELTDLAEGFTLEDYTAQGWTQQQLLNEGLLREVPFVPPPAAVVPLKTAPAAPKPSLPTRLAPAITSAAMASGGVSELDAEKLPWDARIHSSSKEKIANGTWKVKRNTPVELVAQVKNELRTLLGNGKVATKIPPPVAKGPTPPATKGVPAPIASGEAPNACALFMRKASAAIRAGTLTQPDILRAVNEYGVAQVKDLNLAVNAAFIPLIDAELFGADA